MLKLLKSTLWIASLALFALTMSSHGYGQDQNQNKGNANSITFVAGDDVDQTNTFYKMATQFFFENDQYKTEIVIDHLRSLEDIVEYLNSHKPPQGEYWSTINIVTHSSRFGLQVAITNDANKTTTKSWQEFSKKYRHKFPRVIKHLRKSSVVTVWGCSFGKTPKNLKHLRQLFRGVDGLAILRSPNKRLFFKLDSIGQEIRHFYSDEYTVNFKEENTPPPVLLERFKHEFVDANIDWEVALATQGIKNDNLPFHSSSVLRIKFYVDKSALNSYRTLKRFVRNQPEIMNHLQGVGLALKSMKFSVERASVGQTMVVIAETQRVTVCKKSSDGDAEVMIYAAL